MNNSDSNNKFKITKIKVVAKKQIQEKIKEYRPTINKEESASEVFNFEKIKQDKKMVMVTGVAFFMVLIISFWLLNIKNIFQLNSSETNNKFNWGEIKKELSGVMGEIKKNIKEIKNLQSTASDSLRQPERTAETKNNIELLKQRLSDKILSEQATTTFKLK